MNLHNRRALSDNTHAEYVNRVPIHKRNLPVTANISGTPFPIHEPPGRSGKPHGYYCDRQLWALVGNRGIDDGEIVD